VTCACNLIVAQVLATRELRTLVFTSRTRVNGPCTSLSSKSVTAVTLERVDTVVTDRVGILACAGIRAISVQNTVVLVHFASRANEALDTAACHATNEVCAFTLMKARCDEAIVRVHTLCACREVIAV
jgi:hypothetical protein